MAFNWLLVAAVVFVFLAVALGVQAIAGFWSAHRAPEVRRFKERVEALKRVDPAAAARLDGEEGSEAPGSFALALQTTAIGRRVDLLLLQQTRYRWTPSGLIARMVGWSCIGLLLVLLLNVQTPPKPIAALIAMVVFGSIPWYMLARARAQRLAKVEQQLPDTIDFIERAMRAGHAFSSAIQMAGQQTPDPLAREFRFVSEQINYGVSLKDALGELVLRTPSPDLNYFVVSVLIQRETGGNLTELLRHVSAAVRERIRFNGQLKVLSSEGRASGRVLTALPFGVGGLLYLVNPGFMGVLINDPAGPGILTATALWMAVGIIWMRAIVKINI